MSVELAVRILCDFVPRDTKLDAVHLMGQTALNHESVLSRGNELLLEGKTSLLTVMDEAISGYPGGQIWERFLRLENTIGIITQLSFPTLNGAKASNSLGEAVAFVQKAKEKNWQSVGMVAAPFHQIRCFLSFVPVILRELPNLKLYNIVGTNLRWNENVVHSQGIQRGTRARILQDELVKIVDYTSMGHLASTGQGLSYLNERDGISF